MKRLFTTVTVALFGMMLSCSAPAASLSDEAAASALATKAMSTLKEKGVRGVFETVAPHWTRSPVELASVISDSEEKREHAAKSLGAYLGFEKIAEKKAGDSLYMVTMLEKTEKKAIVWYFSFYKPKDKWILWSCYWDPNFESLLLLGK